MDEAKQAADAINKDLRVYRKLNELNKDPNFDAYFELLIKTCSDKMIWAFTGNNVKNWDDFCKVRGEVVALLFGVQEVRGSDAMVKHLSAQLEDYYKNPNA